MNIIIDPYRGGNDIGKNIDGKYEKDILLELSKYMSNLFNDSNIDTILTRDKDISLTDDERNNIISKIKNDDDLIIQNRLNDNDEFNIIYSLKNNDKLVSLISNKLDKNNIILDNYYQKRLPGDTSKDYYSIIRNNLPTETIIIEYKDLNNYKEVVPIIVDAIKEYLFKDNIYVVKKGDSLYSISKKYNISVSKLKDANNLSSNNLSIGDILYIPKEESNINEEKSIYTVKKGDSLYSISKKYNVKVSEIKELNNLSSNILQIGDKLIIPISNNYIEYIVKKGDSLYSISKKYNVKVNEIKELNNLSSNILQIGDKLKIPK